MEITQVQRLPSTTTESEEDMEEESQGAETKSPKPARQSVRNTRLRAERRDYCLMNSIGMSYPPTQTDSDDTNIKNIQKPENTKTQRKKKEPTTKHTERDLIEKNEKLESNLKKTEKDIKDLKTTIEIKDNIIKDMEHDIMHKTHK